MIKINYICTLLGVWWLLAHSVHCSYHCNCETEVRSGPLSRSLGGSKGNL